MVNVFGPNTWNGSGGGWSLANFRFKIDKSLLTGTTGKIQIVFAGSTVEGCDVFNMYVGHYAAGGNAWKMDGSQAQVTFNGGSSGFVLSAGQTITSDTITFAFDGTKDLIISGYHNNDAANDGFRKDTTVVGTYQYYKQPGASAESGQDDPATYLNTPNQYMLVQTIIDRELPVTAENSLLLTPSVVDSGIHKVEAAVALSLTPVAAAKKLYDALAENSLTLTPAAANKPLYLVAADVSLTVTPSTSEVAELQVGCAINLTLTQGTFYLWTESCDTAYGTARPRSKDNHIFMYTPFTAPNLGMQLSRPEYNNIDEDNYQISTQHAISGTKHVFAHTPTYKTLHLSFKHQSKRKVQEFKNFIGGCAGIDIRLIDWELRQWRGMITNSTLPIITTGKGPYSEESEFSFIFEGEEL